MAQEMSLSDNFKTTFTRIGQNIAASTKQECSSLLAPGQHLCAGGRTPEGDKLVQWNNCFKKQAAKEASKNAFTMLKLVSSEICKGQAYTYLSDDGLWTEVLPQYMRKYAETCQAPGAAAAKEQVTQAETVVNSVPGTEEGKSQEGRDEL